MQWRKQGPSSLDLVTVSPLAQFKMTHLPGICHQAFYMTLLSLLLKAWSVEQHLFPDLLHCNLRFNTTLG